HLVVLLAVDVPADLLRRDAAVPLDRVRVERRLAGRAGTGPVAADAGRLVARAARAHSTVEGAPDRVGPVDVLHDVDLADARPVGVDTAERRPEGPEGRPVTLRGRAGHVGHLEAALDAQLPAGRRLEVGALGLDPAGRPRAVGRADRLDRE